MIAYYGLLMNQKLTIYMTKNPAHCLF